MSLEGLSLYKGKQPIGILNVYNDKVEFINSGRSAVAAALKNAFFFGGAIGVIVSAIADEAAPSKRSKPPVAVDTYAMSEIAVAIKSKHPKTSSFIEIVLKNGEKMKYLDRDVRYSVEQMGAFVDAVNANL